MTALPLRAVVGHFEIPADDLERAAAFYRTVFGWRVERLAWDGPGYSTIRMPAAEVGREPSALDGGLMERRGLGSEHPLLVVHVEGEGALEECLERITAAGGTVEQPPRPIEDLGTFARFRDSEGNLLGLWRKA